VTCDIRNLRPQDFLRLARVIENRGPACRDGTSVGQPWNMAFNDSNAARSTVGAVVVLALFAIGRGSSSSTTSNYFMSNIKNVPREAKWGLCLRWRPNPNEEES
jgi:hypothetical protein